MRRARRNGRTSQLASVVRADAADPPPDCAMSIDLYRSLSSLLMMMACSAVAHCCYGRKPSPVRLQYVIENDSMLTPAYVFAAAMELGLAPGTTILGASCISVQSCMSVKTQGLSQAKNMRHADSVSRWK